MRDAVVWMAANRAKSSEGATAVTSAGGRKMLGSATEPDPMQYFEDGVKFHYHAECNGHGNECLLTTLLRVILRSQQRAYCRCMYVTMHGKFIG
jgi:hypothetical protein